MNNGVSKDDPKLIVCSIEKVLKFDVWNGVSSNGTQSTLCLTNSKLYFVSHAKKELPNKINELVDVQLELSLSCIKDVQAIVDSREIAFEDIINNEASDYEKLVIRCKDFREICLTFRDQTDNVMNFFQSLWAKLFLENKSISYYEITTSKNTQISSFLDEKSWRDELTRLCINRNKTQWKVMTNNETFDCCPLIGPYSVIPNSMDGGVVARTGNSHTNDRYITWCWTSYESMVSLLRCSEPKTIPNKTYLSKIVSTMVSNKAHAVVNTARLKDYCPTEETIAYSYEKLWNAVVHKDDDGFLRYYELSKWPVYIQSFVRAARHTARTLILDKTPVAVMDITGIDVSCIVTSLVQILVDPHCRTTRGFMNLINKEWLAGGYPFGRTISRMNTRLEDSNTGTTITRIFQPSFVMFLDCVHCVIDQYPVEFEFTDNLLIIILDEIYSNNTPLFTFDSIKSMCTCYTLHQIDQMVKLFWESILMQRDSYANALFRLNIDQPPLLDNARFDEEKHRARSKSYMYAVQKGYDSSDNDKSIKRRSTIMLKQIKKAHIPLPFHRNKKKIRKPRDKKGANFFVSENESPRDRLSSISNIFKSKSNPININYSLVILRPWDRLFFRYLPSTTQPYKGPTYEASLTRFVSSLHNTLRPEKTMTLPAGSRLLELHQSESDDDVSPTGSLGTNESDRLERSVHLSDLDLYHDQHDRDFESPDEISLNNLSVENNSDYSSPVVMTSSCEVEKRGGLGHVHEEEPERLNSKSPKTVEKEIEEAANDIHDV